MPVFEDKQAEEEARRRRAARKLNTQGAKHNLGIAKAHQILAYYTRTSPVTPAHRLHVACTLPQASPEASSGASPLQKVR